MTDPVRPQLKFWETALYVLAVGLGIRRIAVAAAVGPASLHPVPAFLKIVISAAAMVAVGLFFYWIAERRRRAALAATAAA